LCFGLTIILLSLLFLFYRSTALASAICAGAAIKLFGWDLKNPESLKEVNTKGSREYTPNLQEAQRKKWQGWQKTVERSRGWKEGAATLMYTIYKRAKKTGIPSTPQLY
jgi:hypothetical protein